MGTKSHKFELGAHVWITALKIRGRVDAVVFHRCVSQPMYSVFAPRPEPVGFRVYENVTEDDLEELLMDKPQAAPRSVPLPDPLPR